MSYFYRVIRNHVNRYPIMKLGVAIPVDGSGLCRVEIKVYDCMAQPKPDPFINCFKMGQLALTRNTFTVKLIQLVHVGFVSGSRGCVKHCHPLTEAAHLVAKQCTYTGWLLSLVGSLPRWPGS